MIVGDEVESLFPTPFVPFFVPFFTSVISGDDVGVWIPLFCTKNGEGMIVGDEVESLFPTPLIPFFTSVISGDDVGV